MELRTSVVLNLSAPKSAQTSRAPWILVGICTCLWFPGHYRQLLDNPFSPSVTFFYLREDGQGSPGLRWRHSEKAAMCKPGRTLSPGTWRTCTRKTTFCFYVHKGQGLPAFSFEGPQWLLLLIWISFTCRINKRVHNRPQCMVAELLASIRFVHNHYTSYCCGFRVRALGVINHCQPV